MMGFLNFFGGANGAAKEKLGLYRVIVDVADTVKFRESSLARTVNAFTFGRALTKSVDEMYLHGDEVVKKFSIKILPKEGTSWF